MKRIALAAIALCVFAMGATGCQQTPGAKVAQDIKMVQTETTADKLLARGRAFAEVGDNTRAEQYLAAALDQGADRDVALPLLLKVCITDGRYRVAIDYAEPQLRKHPNDNRLRFVLASLYATIGESKAAREQLEALTRAEPNQAEVHYALARLLRDDENDPVNADLHFREYLRLRPTGPHAQEARAALLRSVP